MKPILFNTEMVLKILNGEKTVTRRVIREQPRGKLNKYSGPVVFFWDSDIRHPPYIVGDILYVRETWQYGGPLDGNDQVIGPMRYYYAADGDPFDRWLNDDGTYHEGMKWRPSIHMPKAAARIFLRVTDVRAEKLQESFFRHGDTVRSIAAEGIDIGDQCRECIEAYGCPCCIDDESECGVLDDVRDDFASLWDSTIPKHPNKFKRYLHYWKDNPWVWVISFERCERPKEVSPDA